jgi:hypothetical protein
MHLKRVVRFDEEEVEREVGDDGGKDAGVPAPD